MRFFAVMGLIATANLVGCSSTRGWIRMNTYHFQADTIELEGEKFKVYRHKADNSLMVSPPLSTPQTPPTFADPLTSYQKARSVAQRHLEIAGRNRCKVINGGRLQGQIQEFWFECPP